MTYPQPNASDYSSQGAKFFRLNTQLVSGGDIYESDQGSQAFVIGPESDISRVKVTYFDKQAPDFVNNVIIGLDRQFVGLLQANTKENYAPASRPGRVLIAPDDLYNPDWGPISPIANSTILLIPPVMDVIQYFNDPGSLVAGRNDKTFRFQNIAWGTDNHSPIYLAVPFYGRKYASWDFEMATGSTDTMQLVVFGVTMNYIDDAPSEVTLVPQTTGAISQAGAYDVAQTPPSNGHNGMYDFLLFELTLVLHNSAQPGLFAKVVVSDKGI